MLGGVIHVAADGADVLAGGLLLGEIHFGQDGRHGVVEVHHSFGFQVLVTLRGVGAAIDGGMVAHELADAVLRLAGGGQVVEDHGEFVLIQRFVNVSNVAMKHIEQAVVLHHDDAVALGMPLGLDEVDAVVDFLTVREVIIGAVGEADGDEIPKPLELSSVYLVGIDIDLGVGEAFQLAAVVGVFVGEQDLGHPLGLVAEGRERLHIAADVLAGEGQRIFIGCLLGRAGGETGIDENHLAAGVDEVVLQAAAIADVAVELVGAFFTAHNKRLGVETLFSEFYCFDFHNLILL